MFIINSAVIPSPMFLSLTVFCSKFLVCHVWLHEWKCKELEWEQKTRYSLQIYFILQAHGLHMCEHEGEGTGRCVAVMVGGRSGGHKGAVLCSVRLSWFTRPSTYLILHIGVSSVFTSDRHGWGKFLNSRSMTFDTINTPPIDGSRREDMAHTTVGVLTLGEAYALQRR